MPRFENHPLSRLTAKNGKLQLIGGEEYLTTLDVQVTSKEELHETDGSTEVTYTFRLNCQPDSTWAGIFQKVDGVENAFVDRDYLYLRCIPANLEGRYQTARDAVSQTNRLYAEHKTLLTDKVADLDVQRSADEKAKQNRSKVVKEQFEKLKL